ncbi:hypothetical protein NQZ68_010944 [Dissostichus eleginoides]|nr:hypothetical protein NQZ68_010944 [Dissostichus eleginoides]
MDVCHRMIDMLPAVASTNHTLTIVVQQPSDKQHDKRSHLTDEQECSDQALDDSSLEHQVFLAFRGPSSMEVQGPPEEEGASPRDASSAVPPPGWGSGCCQRTSCYSKVLRTFSPVFAYQHLLLANTPPRSHGPTPAKLEVMDEEDCAYRDVCLSGLLLHVLSGIRPTCGVRDVRAELTYSPSAPPGALTRCDITAWPATQSCQPPIVGKSPLLRIGLNIVPLHDRRVHENSGRLQEMSQIRE